MSTTYQAKLDAMVAENGEIVRWLIAIAVSVAALMEVIDTSIVNVALPFIKGNLGATLSEVGWVVTGYSMANGVMIPLTAWLGNVFGRKGYFIFSLIGFTLASILCGVSSTLPMLVIARIAQGLFGGGLLAKAQTILFESFPKEKQGLAQALFGVCVIVGPIMGPTLGGYLTDLLDWRWIFFINVPVGIAAIIMCSIFLPDDNDTKPSKIDWWGIILLTVGLSALQYVLEKGQDDDWFSSPAILTLAVVSVGSLVVFVAQELTVDEPAVDLRILKLRSVSGGVIYSLVMGMGLFGIGFTVPNFAQGLLNYTAMETGLLQMPGSIASGFMMPILGIMARKTDARFVVGLGAILTAVSMFLVGGIIGPDTGPNDFFWPLILRGVATAMMFMPLTLASIGDCKPNQIAGATGFMNLSRMLGGSIGVAIITTILSRRTDFHRAILVEKITEFSPAVMERQHQMTAMMQQQGQSHFDAGKTASTMLNNVITMQASVLSYADIFWLLGAMFIVSLPVVFLLAKGSAAKNVDAH